MANEKDNNKKTLKKISSNNDSAKKTVKKNSSKKNGLKRMKEKSTKKTTGNDSHKKINKKVIDIEVVDESIKNKLKKIDLDKSVHSESDFKETSPKELNFSLFEVILLIIITILSCILIGYFLISNSNDNNNSNENEIADQSVQKFLEQYNYILENYYGDIDKEQLIKDAIEGMFSSLDAYSEVIDQESNTFTITLKGEYEGVGIVIANDMLGNIVIQDVYKDTPAYKAGLQANDVIIKFNDTSLNNIATSQLVDMIASANEMQLTIMRNEQQIVVSLKREKIVLQSVNYEMLENKIGYISVDIFASNTKEQFEKALNDLESQNMQSLIIDLRNNTGGHLSTVEKMLYLFLDKSHVIYQMEDKSGIEKFYSKGKEDKKYKIVILQNGLSASASEIMTAALSEELGAYIIGNKSFGKGTVQTLKDVDGDIQYKFTTKRWLTPKGIWVNEVGIEPNLEVNLSEEYYQNPIFDNDTQLKSAIDYLNS